MPKLDTETLVRFYCEEHLTLAEIGKRYGVSRQALQQRLERAGVERRSTGPQPSPLIEEQDLRKLASEKRLTVQQTAERLGVSVGSVKVSRAKYGIRAPGGPLPKRKYPELADLQISESIVVPKPDTSYPWRQIFYGMARRLGISIKVKTLNDSQVRLTRVG